MRWRRGGRSEFKGSQGEREIILWGVRWDGAYPISDRQLEDLRGERGGAGDHATRNRWILKEAPELEKQLRRQRPPGGGS